MGSQDIEIRVTEVAGSISIYLERDRASKVVMHTSESNETNERDEGGACKEALELGIGVRLVVAFHVFAVFAYSLPRRLSLTAPPHTLASPRTRSLN